MGEWPAMQRKHLARLSTVVGIGLGIAAVAFVVRFLARDWDEVSDSLADARPGWVLAAFVTAALAMTARMKTFKPETRMCSSFRWTTKKAAGRCGLRAMMQSLSRWKGSASCKLLMLRLESMRWSFVAFQI